MEIAARGTARSRKRKKDYRRMGLSLAVHLNALQWRLAGGGGMIPFFARDKEGKEGNGRRDGRVGSTLLYHGE